MSLIFYCVEMVKKRLKIIKIIPGLTSVIATGEENKNNKKGKFCVCNEP